ncbi:MAG TPA: tetratricopeptide repeat protein [Verrucomicrobiales bacterium]|nr:tetratricopeptide repeat protein [Verrucomicrobiales bacterium]
MKKLPVRALPALLVIGAVMTPLSSDAVLKKLFKRDRQVVPSVEQTPQREAQAEALFREAEATSKAGNAVDLYRKLVKNYPHSRYAPEAQYRIALHQDQHGTGDKAFKAYQELIEKYRSTPHFDEALNRQFQIASASHTSKTGRFLGLPTSVSRSRVVTMYEQIIANAPTSRYAADAQFNIGLIHENGKKYQEAITAYQSVVDDYPRSGRAPEAQLRIGEIMGATIERGNRNPVSLVQTREAYEDFLTNFPEHGAAEDALMNIDLLSAQEARKNLQVGSFYERQGNPGGAAIYYNQVARNSDDPALQAEAQQRLDKLAASHPQAVEVAQASASTGGSAARLLKARPEYAGPLAPDVAQAKQRKPGAPNQILGMPDLLNSDADQVPFLPIEEPELPSAGDSGDPINIDPIIPPDPEDMGDFLDFPVIDAGDSFLGEEPQPDAAADEEPEPDAEGGGEEDSGEEDSGEESGEGSGDSGEPAEEEESSGGDS